MPVGRYYMDEALVTRGAGAAPVVHDRQVLFAERLLFLGVEDRRLEKLLGDDRRYERGQDDDRNQLGVLGLVDEVVGEAGPAGLWAAILAATIGPNLLVTGSVATLIARRIARDGGAGLGAGRFSAVGAVLVPAQLAAAILGLHVTGALT